MGKVAFLHSGLNTQAKPLISRCSVLTWEPQLLHQGVVIQGKIPAYKTNRLIHVSYLSIYVSRYTVL